jgi:polyhydroxyalkanoate synthase subunit PhaC
MMTHPPTQTPNIKTGPHPLALHVALLTMLSATSLSALSSLKNGLLPWRPHLAKAASELTSKLQNVDTETFAKALHKETLRRHEGFANGIKQYWSYARSQHQSPPDVIWQEGTTRLLDFGSQSNSAGNKSKRPLLIIPSLINRYHVLDLSNGRSFARALRDQGFHPYIIDWNAPGEDEKDFKLSDYIIKRLEPALKDINKRHHAKVGIIGYCMGGLLSLALAHRKPDQTQNLSLLATPWDFHTGHEAQILMLKAMQPHINTMIDTIGEIPVDVLQAMFSSLNPWLTIDKFQRFSKTDTDDLFVELEDWLNSGPPLAGPAGRECLNEWYIENTPFMGEWCVDGTPVLPEQINTPCLAIIPQRDHIVPPKSASAIVEKLPNVETININKGHVGMIVGNGSQKTLVEPLSEWLSKNF